MLAWKSCVHDTHTHDDGVNSSMQLKGVIMYYLSELIRFIQFMIIGRLVVIMKVVEVRVRRCQSHRSLELIATHDEGNEGQHKS